MENKDIQKELDKVISLPKKDEPKAKDFVEVLIKQLDYIISLGEVGYKQEILLPIPQTVFDERKAKSSQAIYLAGKLNNKLGIPAELKTEEITGRDGNKLRMINVIIVIEDVEAAKKAKAFIEEEE